MNAIFQEYKRQTDELQVVFTDNVPMNFEIRAMTFSVNKHGSIEYNRAKTKRETRKAMDDYLSDQER